MKTEPNPKTASKASPISEATPGYHFDIYGILTQSNLEITASYDERYLQKYDDCPCEDMAALRCKLIEELPLPCGSIFDIGYGRGHLLRLCSEKGMGAYGYDITGYKIPDADNVIYSDLWGMGVDVMTFFDSLEHFSDLTFLRDITAKQVVVSVPWLPDVPASELPKWRHWRPGEHLRHFNLYSLKALFFDLGYHLVTYGNPEDKIRKSAMKPNILTASFIRSELVTTAP